MPRKHPKPFFRTARNAWYVQLGTSQIKLIDGPKNADTEAAAYERYHEVMAARVKQKDRPEESVKTGTLTVAELFDKFLTWCKRHRGERTYDWYRERIQWFISFDKQATVLPTGDLRPYRIVEWIDSHGDRWGDAYRRGAIVALQRPYNWGVQMGLVASNPISGIEKPSPGRSERVMMPTDWEKVKAHYPEGDPFRDLLEFAYETGCRPRETKRIESRHVDLGRMRVVFPAEEAKGKRRARVILLTQRASTILDRLLKSCKSGPLFVNAKGKPWTAQAMACRFGRLRKHIGVKWSCYAIRHGMCERLLEDGVDHLTAAEILGHADGKMVATTYQHLNRAESHLREALNRATGKRG